MADSTLLDLLVLRFPTAKRQTLKRMVQAGRVRVDGRAARTLRDAVAEGARLEVLDTGSGDRGAARSREVDALPFRVVYEDADVLVVDKPTGLLTSTVPGEPRPTLLAAVRRYAADTDPSARIGLIHRLDRDVSGLLVFSKNDVAYKSLKTQLFKRLVTRQYAAVVRGTPAPPKGQIRSHLVERADGTVRSTKQAGKGELAITQYERVGGDGKRSLLRVTLQTGRKHQIRVHLRERGTPVVGDRVYGPDADIKAPPNARLMLAATKLVFQHPRTAERVTFEIPTPPEFGL